MHKAMVKLLCHASLKIDDVRLKGFTAAAKVCSLFDLSAFDVV